MMVGYGNGVERKFNGLDRKGLLNSENRQARQVAGQFVIRII
jgi:hypothetical protein